MEKREAEFNPTFVPESQALRHLDADRVFAIFLKKGRGLTDEEIGLELGIPRSGVYTTAYGERVAQGSVSTTAVTIAMVNEGHIAMADLTEGLDFSRYALLTEAEKRLLKALIDKKDDNRNIELAYELNIKPRTVKNELSSAYKKLGVKNRIQAAMFEFFRPKEEESTLLLKDQDIYQAE
jgi:DNA-binding CsgD family transcriptional regulator